MTHKQHKNHNKIIATYHLEKQYQKYIPTDCTLDEFGAGMYKCIQSVRNAVEEFLKDYYDKSSID